MRAFAMFLATVSTIVIAGPRPGEASPYYPWCAHMFRSGAISCWYATKAQCAESVSGRGGFCMENAADPPIGLALAPEGHRYGSSHPTRRHHHHPE